MAILSKLHRIVGEKPAANSHEASISDPNVVQMKANDKEAAHDMNEIAGVSKNDEDRPTEDAQVGVRQIEAVTLAWGKGSVFTVLIFIWFLTLINNMKSSMVYSLTAYATSSFMGHSLLTVITIVANAMTAAVYIPMAKALDLWGRAEGLLLMTLFCIIGLILLATSQNLETYCAGEVFYSVGFGGLAYSWDVLAADVTNLRNRGLAFAFTSSPALISAFAGSKAAAEFLLHVDWRWGYGIWAIILPFFALPIYLILAHSLRKAERKGIIVKEKKSWSFNLQTIQWIFIEFDVLGVILFAGGFVVFLLPFTLASSAPDGWKTGYIIAMIVVGFVTIIVFGLYETYVASRPFLDYKFLTDRTILGACLLDMTYQISYYCYGSYLSSFLQVVYELDVATAGYVGNTFSVVSFVFLFIAGWLIRWTGRFKWILWICVPMYIFGLGLMIHFRQPGGYIGYIVMCEVFFSVSGGIFILCVQIAALASVDHQHVAAALALVFVSGSIGGAIGSAICGAIWTNTFLKQLELHLPASAMPNLALIYSQLPVQLSYEVGSPERDAIVKAYGYAQPKMLIAGTVFMVLGFIWVGMMKNLNVKKMTQTRGNVF